MPPGGHNVNERNRRRLVDLVEADRHRWQPDPEEAERIARIVERFLGGADIRPESPFHADNLAAWVRDQARRR